MTLITMGIQGSIMIVAILLLRFLLLNRLPKALFGVLWGLVVCRLLVPVQIAIPFGLWGIANRMEPRTPAPVSESPTTSSSPSAAIPQASPTSQEIPVSPSASEPLATPVVTQLDPNSAPPLPDLLATIPWWMLAWVIGSVLCCAVFIALYLRGRTLFKTASPVTCAQATRWLDQHRLRRSISIRQCAGISAPLTYGVARPVILVPPAFNWDDTATADLVLEHEYAHIARFDALRKPLLAIAVCVHWFNPLVWAMYLVANRDIELACDARVSRQLDPSQRACYARMLLQAGHTGLAAIPLSNSFAKSSIEERVVSVVKYRPTTWGACIASVAIALAIPMAFATSAPENSQTTQLPSVAANTGIAVEGRPITSNAYTDEEWAAIDKLYRYTCQDTTPFSNEGPSIKVFRLAMDAAFEDLDADDLLDRLASDGWLQRQIGTNGMATFIELALLPLSTDNWQDYVFTGARSIQSGETLGVLTFRYTFAPTQDLLEQLAESSHQYEDLRVGMYMALATRWHYAFMGIFDAMPAQKLGDPNSAMEYIDQYYIPQQGMPTRHSSTTFDVRYRYAVQEDGGSWEIADTVGYATYQGVLDTGSLDWSHGLELGTLDVEISPDAIVPVSVRGSALTTTWFAYERFGFSIDPFTGKLLYQGEPVRLFVDGYAGSFHSIPGEATMYGTDSSGNLLVPAGASETPPPTFYYVDPEGTIDLSTDAESFGSAALGAGMRATFQTPIRSIVELTEDEARTVVENCWQTFSLIYPNCTPEEVFGSTGPESSGFLPRTTSLLAMNATELAAYIQESGYTYNQDDRAFYKDGGAFKDRTGQVCLRILGAPDELGYRGLSLDQVLEGEAVEAITAALLFDDVFTSLSSQDALEAVNLLEASEGIMGGTSLGTSLTVEPVTSCAGVGCTVNGQDAVWTAEISGRAGISASCSYLEPYAESWDIEPTFEAVAQQGIWGVPYYVNPLISEIR